MPAKKQINLFPKKSFSKSSTGKFLQWALTYGRYIIIGTEIVVLLAFIMRFKLDRDITDLREEIAQKEAIVQANRDFELEFRHIQNRLAQIKLLSQNQSRIIQLFRQIEILTPQEVFFTALSMSDTSATFTVTAASPQGLTVFVNNIRQSPFFHEIRIDSLKQTNTGGVEFSVIATLDPPAGPTETESDTIEEPL